MYTYTHPYDAYTFHKSQHFFRVNPTELEQEKEPEPEKDPAEVQALEHLRRFDGYLSQL